MAKNDFTRSIRITIDNSDAMKSATDLKKRISDLQTELQSLSDQGKRDDVDAKRKEKELQRLQGAYGRLQERIADTERVLKNLSGATRGELLTVQKQLQNDLKKTTRDTVEYTEKLKALHAVNAELAKTQNEMSQTGGKLSSTWSRMADGVNKYFGVVLSFLGSITGLSFGLQRLVDEYAKLDDAQANVRKYTGLTREEIVELNKDFDKLDTRTARIRLNELAGDAGRLGIQSKKNILDFVDAANILDVALEEDLGEGAIKSIGKLAQMFGDADKMGLKQAMLSTGSAINEIAQNSSAAEPYLVDFTNRLSGVGNQAGFTVSQIIGLGSVLDQNAQQVETSATALSGLIMKVYQEPAKFAKIAGLDVKEFTTLMKKDANEALLTLLDTLGKKGGLADLAPIFKDMNLNGARSSSILSVLAGNIQKVRDEQSLATKAFADGTSVINEYDVQNNTFSANLEKRKNVLLGYATAIGEKLSPLLLEGVSAGGILLKIILSLLNYTIQYAKYILYLATAYGVYVAGVKLALYWEKAMNVVMALSRLRYAAHALEIAIAAGNTTRAAAAQRVYTASMVQGGIVTKGYVAVTSLLSAAKYFLTGNIVKARAAMQTFTATLAINPMTIATTALLALVAAFAYLYIKTRDVITAQKAVKDSTDELNSSLAQEQSEANKLFEALKRANPQSDEARRIKDKIITLYGPYLKGLVDEKGNLTDIALAQKIVNDQIRENISLKIKQAATGKIQESSVKQQVSDMDELMSAIEKQMQRVPGYTKEASNAVRENLNQVINQAITEGKTGMVELTKVITDVVTKENINLKEVNGLFVDPKSLNMNIAVLASGVYNSQKEIQKVEDQFKGMISQATELNALLGDTGGGTGGEGDGDTPPGAGETKASKQKKALSIILETLETKHQERLLDIKIKYRDRDITSESEYDQKLFLQEQAYSLLREQALDEFVKKVSDKELKSDINKQLAEIRTKRLDDEIKFRQKIEQIILDANPEAKELVEYKNRLRDYGLYGIERDKLTSEQLIALELLEQQHNDNLVRIRSEARRKAKTAGEEEFNEDFAERKEELLQIISEEEQRVTLLNGIGALSANEAFNAEVALQQKRIALLQEEVAARQKAGLDVSKLLQKQRAEELNMTQLYVGEYNKRRQQYDQYATSIGTTIGNVISGQENAMAAFGDTLIDIMFDVLSQIINTKIVEATAVALAEQAKAAAIAFAMPDSVFTFGASGAARSAAIGALIMGGLAVAKSALKGMLGKSKNSSSSPSSTTGSGSSGQITVKQQATGKYDVIGEQDGQLYKNVSYSGPAKTGMVYQPTLVGEKGAELVVSSPDMKSLQRHINYPMVVQAINDARTGRVPQRASGKYDSLGNYIDNPGFNAANFDPAVLQQLSTAIDNLNKKEFNAYLGVTEYQAMLDRVNENNARFTRS